jgi:tetratricopeptide (TPR) repeat protein
MAMRPSPISVRLLVAAAVAASAYAQDTVQGGDVSQGNVAHTIIVSGSVERSTPGEETALPPDIRIAVECHGDSFDGGDVSLSGQFRFNLTPDPQALAANSLCTVQAVVFGWDSSMLRFPVRSTSGLVNIGALTIHRNASGNAQDQTRERTARTISATSLKAPPNAVKLFEHGLHSLQQGKFPDAIKDFESANRIYPDYAESWLNLGRAREASGTVNIARDDFLRAAQLDPQLAEAPEELGLLAAGQNDLASAARYLDESIRLDPGGSYRACYSDAVVNLMLKRYDAAESSARAAMRFGDAGTQARVDYVLGIALLAKGENAEARQRLGRYLELSPKAPERDRIEKELSRLEQLQSAK